MTALRALATSLRPFFSYYGAKWRLTSQGAYNAPRFKAINEPFAGSAGYSLHFHDKDVRLYDAYEPVCGVWNYLISASEDEILRLPNVPLSTSFTTDDLDVPQEAKWLMGFWLNRANQQPCKSPSAWMRSGKWPNRFWGEAARHRITSQQTYIRHWKCTLASYEQIDVGGEPVTWFVDPPYQVYGCHYRKASIDYTSLAEWCRRLPGQITVCESEDATWLPFAPIGYSQGTRFVSAEAVYEQ